MLTSSLGTPVAVICVGADGRCMRKFVIPAQWDPSAPKSLLGCQMSNQCPADHPAIAAARKSSRMPSRTAATAEDNAVGTPANSCWARCALVMASLLQLCVVVIIVGLPTVSPGAADLLRLARLDKCASPTATPAARRVEELEAANQSSTTVYKVSTADDAATAADDDAITTAANTAAATAAVSATASLPAPSASPSSPPVAVSPPPPLEESPPPLASPPPPAESPPPRAKAAKASVVSSPTSRATSPMPTSPPTAKSAAAAKQRSSSSTTTTTAPAATATSAAAASAAIAASAAATTAAPSSPSTAASSTTTAPASAASFSSSGLGLLTVGRDATGAALPLSSLQLDGQMDMDDMVLGVFIACCVLGVIALLGLTVACSRPSSCVRATASTLYYVTSLPVWVALGFAVAFCFLFRAEAEVLVRRYWLCLLLTEPQHMNGAARTAWGAAAAVYQSVTLAATLLLGCNVLLLAGLYAASRVIGAGVIAAHMLNVINCSQLLVGAALCAVAAGLHARAEGSVHADAVLLVLGASVLALSSLGLLASRLHSRCLLRLYELLALLVTLGLVAFVVVLSLLGVKGISDSSFLEENWHFVRDIYPLAKEDFLRLLGNHWSKLMIAASLLSIVQLIVLAATCTLRRAVLAPGGKERATASERAGLISDGDASDEA